MYLNSHSSTYVVTLKTLVLEPVLSELGVETRIIEMDKVLTDSKTPLHSIRHSCLHYGHSFQNAMHSAKKFLNRLHKPPIVIAFNHGSPITFFPTLSPNAPDNVWIALHAVSNIHPIKNGCIIHLINGDKIKVNVASTTIYRQIALGNCLEKEHVRRFKNFSGHFPD